MFVLPIAYPSLKNLGAWTQDLIQRIEFISTWATKLQPPPTFVLAFFTFPTGFLTAVLQVRKIKTFAPQR